MMCSSLSVGPQMRWVLYLLLLVMVLDSAAAGAATKVEEETSAVLELVERGITTQYTLPDSTVVLHSRNYEHYLFTEKAVTPRAFLVLCYSPWCPHCKSLLPEFLNASLQLDEMQIPHTPFAVVDVVQNREVAEYFDLQRFPTLLYTTGKGKQWYLYEGGNTQQAFMQFSVYLRRAVDTGSFSEDVTDVARFEEVEKKSGDARVPCYVYVPNSSTSTPENQRTAQWSQAVDGAASVSNIRFAVIYEKAQSSDWWERASEKYKRVIQKAKACLASGRLGGPGGEALVVFSDRYREPVCFSGPWVEDRDGAPKSGRASTSATPLITMSHSLESFLALHGFHAVEDASSAMFATLAHYPRNYLGVIMTDHAMDDHDTQFVPVLREITQAANAAVEEAHGESLSVDDEFRTPRVSWSYINAAEFELWRTHYDVTLDQLPAVMIIDTKRDRFFKMRTRVPAFEAIKHDVPWKINGEQQRLIAHFAQDVLADVYKAEKLSVAGAIAEFLSHYPGLASLYELVHYDDFVFDAVVMTLTFFTFLLFVGLVGEPLMNRYDTSSKKSATARKEKMD